MRSVPAKNRRGYFCLKSAAVPIAVAVAGLSAAGCSADVSRFDSTSFAFDDPAETGSTSAPTEPVYGGSVNDHSVARTTPRGPYNAGAEVESAQLPDATPASSEPIRTADASPPPSSPSYQARPFRTAAADPAATPGAPYASAPARGDAIEVQRGDTLYGLSRRHGVSLDELMSVNNLTSSSLRPGQKLYLPSGASAAVRGTAPAKVAAAEPLPQPVGPEVEARYRGTHTVKAGESLYNIARANNVKVGELQQVNGITDPRRVRPGTVLKVPGVAPVAAAETIAKPIAPEVPAAPSRVGSETTTQPTMINGATKVAELSDKTSDAAPVTDARPTLREEKVAVAAPQVTTQTVDSVKLRWPAQGKVIAGFGGRPDGTHNDGINLSVPLGTDVRAAESGVVAYAGSELKGYGNLVLLRHDNGWVTAYAHNDELLVKRGDKVSRGQVISKAGKTGSVDQPQVHFELRQGSKPVDPTPYMEQL